MSRFYVPPKNVDNTRNRIFIEKDEAHHIIDVMRMKESDNVVIFDGTGKEYSGFIEKIDGNKKTVLVEIIKTQTPAPGKFPVLHLCQAIPKKGKMDYIVEKATELGVARITPIMTERTIVRPDKVGQKKKVQRWEKIACTAAKQCGRTDIPEIDDITVYNDIVPDFNEYDIVLFACLTDETIPLKKSLSNLVTGKILILIGPEGDFTPDEILSAQKDNCCFVSLGARVLKSDTAGLFVLSVLGYLFSEG